MAIYGNTISFGGGGGSNDTLPPLLDNFKATRLEASLVPPASNSVAFKDIPDGSKIKLIKGSNISATVTYGTTNDLNHRIVFDSNDWTRKQFQFENDSGHNNISDSDIDQWLNATKASGWWTNQSTNTTPPDYASEQGFLYQLGITDELLAQNFNDININATAKAKVGLPWGNTFGEVLSAYTFFNNMNSADVGEYGGVYLSSGEYVLCYNKPQTKAPGVLDLYNATVKIHPMMEPKPETKVALDADGSYYMFENQAGGIVLSADKMEESRAKDLTGAVWVYSDHIPQNKNDGTKIELAREEIVLPEEGNTDIPPISYAEIERAKETTTWSAPEDGYYKFIGVAEGGRSGSAHRAVGTNYNVSGGSGGSGGIVVSVFKLKRGESVSLDVNSNVSFTYGSNVATATRGGSGGSSTITSSDKVQLGIYGKGGTASGGNLENINGKPGSPGKRYEGNKSDLITGAKTVYEKYGSIGGYARSTVKENDVVNMDIGSSAYIAVLKGSDSSSKTLNFTAKASKTIADLPSKTKVKLGRYGSKDLIWYTTKDNTQAQYLILTPEMTVRSPFAGMMLDNAEPSNPDSARQKNGNSRYIQSNSHQWLNSDKPANEWYTAQHEYDAPPDYANINGFLHEWTEAEKGALLSKSWQVEKAKIDGEGTETFFAKVVLPSDIEVGFGKGTEGEALDIFKSADDRTCNDKNWWLRSPYISYNDTSLIVYQYGSKYQYPVIQKYIVRPLVNIDPYTPVSENPDSDGCYTLILSKPIDPNAIVTKNILWDANKNFYARQFTYNSKKQYQTMLEGATTELLLGEAPLSVSNLTISENAGASPTLSWKNPTDKNYYETVVVQKEGSTPPRSTDDGIEVYRGNGESVTVKDLQSTVDYSFGVFTLSPYGNYGEPATISYRYDFPSEPTSYIEIEKITNTTQWVAPEDGYFKFIGLAKSGDGGSNASWNTTVYGGSGGTGGIVASVFRLQKNDVVSITITNNVTIKSSNETATATSGGNGTGGKITHPTGWSGDHGKGGAAGSASGGNLANVTGRVGQNGASSGAGSSYTNSYSGYSTTSGAGGANNSGTNAYAVILRGNTNTPSPQ